MARFYVLSFLLLVALTAGAMISCLSAEAGEVRGLPRGLWVVLILVPLLGPVLYFAFGRPLRGDHPRLSTALSPSPKTRPVAPDDDPEFLSRLGRSRPATGPTPPSPTDGTRAADDARRDASRPKDTGGTNDAGPSAEGGRAKDGTGETRAKDGTDEVRARDDSRARDAKDDGRTRGDARTKDDLPPSDGGH